MFDLSADVSTDLAILIVGIAVLLVIVGLKKTREQGGPLRTDTDIVSKPCQFCGTTTSPTMLYTGPVFSCTRLCLLCALATTDTSPYNPPPSNSDDSFPTVQGK